MILSSQSDTGGTPDKVADSISDGILDACLAAVEPRGIVDLRRGLKADQVREGAF